METKTAVMIGVGVLVIGTVIYGSVKKFGPDNWSFVDAFKEGYATGKARRQAAYAAKATKKAAESENVDADCSAASA